MLIPFWVHFFPYLWTLISAGFPFLFVPFPHSWGRDVHDNQILGWSPNDISSTRYKRTAIWQPPLVSWLNTSTKDGSIWSKERRKEGSDGRNWKLGWDPASQAQFHISPLSTFNRKYVKRIIKNTLRVVMILNRRILKHQHSEVAQFYSQRQACHAI